MTARRLLAALLVAATATLGLAAQPAAAATQSATLAVAPDDGGVLRSGHGLHVSFTVSNTGTGTLPANRISVSLDAAPVASTTQLLDSIAKPSTILLGLLTRADVKVPAIDPGSSVTVATTIAEDDLASILTPASGARRLYAQYGSGAVKQIAESSVVRMAGSGAGSVGFGAVVPVLAPHGTTGIVDVAAQQQLVAPGGAWSTALRAAQSDPAATVALDPAVLASIRLAGSAAPSDVTDFLDRLGQLSNQFVRLPYADVDETLARAAGVDPRAAVDFAGATAADPGATGGTGPTPAPTATAGATDRSALTAWNWSDQTVSWPVARTAGPGDVPALAKGGATLLLTSDDVADTQSRRTAGPLAAVPHGRALVADSTASSLLTAASGEGLAADAALATLTGVLSTAAVTRETTALLATPGRSAVGPRFDRVLSLLAHQPWIRMRSLSQLGAQASPAAVRLRTPPSRGPLVTTARSLAAQERDVEDLGRAATADAAVVTAPQRLALLGMLSAAWRGDDAAWRAGALVAGKAFHRVAGEVQIVRGSNLNAIGTDGTLQVTVANRLPVPVRVRIVPSVSNGKLQFDDTSDSTVDVPAGTSKPNKLLFRTIANGNTDVTLRLTTADGTPIGPAVVRRVNVAAGFDTVVAVALLSALGLLLALGIYRNVQRRRHPRTAEA